MSEPIKRPVRVEFIHGQHCVMESDNAFLAEFEKYGEEGEAYAHAVARCINSYPKLLAALTDLLCMIAENTEREGIFMLEEPEYAKASALLRELDGEGT